MIRFYANGWFRSRSLADGVTLIEEIRIKPSFRCNIWHVRGRDRDLLVDSGFGLVSLVDNVPELSARKTVAVASHSHCDHIGGHHEFSQRAIHDREAAILARPTRFNTVIEPYVTDDMFEAKPPRGFDSATFTITPAPPDRVLQDGDVVDLGNRAFEILHVPGHSPGSVALWERSTGILFSGDVVHDGPGGFGNLLFYHSNEDDYLRSVERLRTLPVNTVHAGHFHSFAGERYLEIIDEYLARKRAPGCPLAGRDHGNG